LHELCNYRPGEPQFKNFIHWLFEQWGIVFHCLRDDCDIQGSPERTSERAVIQAKNGSLFLLEKFTRDKFDHRHRVARAVNFLNQNGLTQALGCKPNPSGQCLPFYTDYCFQVSDFLDGTELKRPDYLASGEMGANFADFLIRLHKAARGIQSIIPGTSFSLPDYICVLMDQAKHNNPDIHAQYLPFVEFLETRFIPEHDTIPISFCHGDLHPLNVIWKGNQINAVIDWEFTGFKPEIFDAANLVGCAGIEDPEGLGMPMVMTFIRELKNAGIISPKGWDLFPEYILALRFAWLSEWLRKNDTEMLDLEARYMEILMTHIDELRRIWNTSPAGK
jgi:homoserine kinase type II